MASMSVRLPSALAVLLVLASSPAASGSTMLPIRAVNLGGWLVVEGWIAPQLFQGVDRTSLMDGTHITLWSVTQKMFLSAAGGGGSTVAADQSKAQEWETFRIWKMENSNNLFKIRVSKNQFLSINNREQLVATATSPSQAAEFQIIMNKNTKAKIRIRAPNGKFLQVHQMGSITADSESSGSWSDSDPSVFNMNITSQMQGDTQLCSFYGAEQAVKILKGHWSTFIVESDFKFISSSGLNAVRIPVAWWITNETDTPSCHPPSYPGYLAVLDQAFDWADKYNLGVIVDLHAAPWSQNGHDHSASRDGTIGWGNSDENIDQTVKVIEALASRYASRKSLLAIELLNEPSPQIPFDTLKKYYSPGYDAVHRHVQRDDVYVIMSGRLMPTGANEILDFASGFKNCVIDDHLYNLYDSKLFSRMTAEGNINYVKRERAKHLKSLTRPNGALVLVGEWVAEWMVKGASDDDYKKFAAAQMEVFSQASFGWAYWTYKNPYPHWSLKDMIKDGIITLHNSSEAQLLR